MNRKFQPFALFCALAVASLILPSVLRADTTYSYKGSPYSGCEGTYASSGSTCVSGLALNITFDTTAPLDSVTDYSVPLADLVKVGDGGSVNITQTNETDFQLIIDTNSVGVITQWSLLAMDGAATGPNTGQVGAAASCYATTDASLLSDQGCDAIGSTGLSPVSPNEGSILLVGTNETDVADGNAKAAPADWTMTTTATPEPSSLLMLGIGVLGLSAMAFWRKNAAESVIV